MFYKLCVMGNPIEHSKSPWIHGQFARQLNLNVEYTKLKPELAEFAKAVADFKKAQGFGFNVTLPFKQEAWQLTARISERAALAKAVNTMMFDVDGNLYGDNTDGIGFITDVKNNLGYSLKDKKILIVGAGGAVRGILHPLLSENPALVIIANRTLENAQQLAAEFKAYGNIRACDFDELENLSVDVIINGMSLNSKIDLPSLRFLENSLAYDLNYGDSRSEFLRWAKSQNISLVQDGLGMLVEQAAEAFFVWTKQKPETQAIIKLARQLFSTDKV